MKKITTPTTTPTTLNENLSLAIEAFNVPLVALLADQTIEAILPNLDSIIEAVETTHNEYIHNYDNNQYHETNTSLGNCVNALTMLSTVSNNPKYMNLTPEDVYSNLFLLVEKLKGILVEYKKINTLTIIK